MLSINPMRSLATVAAIAALLAVAGPANASDASLSGGGDRIRANPSAAGVIVPDGEPSFAIIAADFSYLEFMDYIDDAFHRRSSALI